MSKKSIKVVVAVIRKGNYVFATQRGYGEYKDWWEFPGGKIEEGETPEYALVREIKEELDSDIAVETLLKWSVRKKTIKFERVYQLINDNDRICRHYNRVATSDNHLVLIAATDLKTFKSRLC